MLRQANLLLQVSNGDLMTM